VSVGDKTKITTKKRLLEPVRQISRQKQASVVRQPKIYCEMIGMGAKSITIVSALTADCRTAEVPSEE
jgi:hypothetical protein